MNVLGKALRWVVPVAMAVLIASCQPGNPPAQTLAPNAVCDGITNEAGGCDPERRPFSGTSCLELAEEWGRELDRRAVGILDGPPSVNGERQSSRLRQTLGVVTIDVNTRLVELGLAERCDVPEFLEAAEPDFSEQLRQGVGGALYDGSPPASYEEWLIDVRSVLQMIDSEGDS